ncbi:MAG TPA: hypothetical protein VG387_19325 [Rhizomicrobium sp.]|jgi:hypothetical protein|nr:hypothetical protein [Rhizomicrobium sp.]
MPICKRVLLLAALAAALAGCQSYGDLTSDAFNPGKASQTQFSMDAAGCAAAAEYPRNYDAVGIWGDNETRHEVYNRAYTVCMAKLGYARRDWSGKYPAPYRFDFTP